MAPKANRRASRPPVAAEIERELLNARHYLAQLPLHEAAARAAYDANDSGAVQTAKGAFQRDLSACLNAARTAKNYITAAADAGGQRAWLNERLAPPTYKFHADVAGSIFHDGAIKLDRLLSVHIPLGHGDAQFAVVQAVDGGMDLKPITNNVYRGPLSFIYDATDLGEVLAAQLQTVSSQARPIVDLAADYIHGLEQVLKNALRNERLSA